MFFDRRFHSVLATSGLVACVCSLSSLICFLSEERSKDTETDEIERWMRFPFPEREAFDLAASRSFFGLANQNLVPSVRGTYTFETDVIPNRSALGKHSHEYHRREPERRFEQ
jgi:hypothetical protein